MMKKTSIIIILSTILLLYITPFVSACTGIYAGSETTENQSVYLGRSEDIGPNYVKELVVVEAADHADGEMMKDSTGFSVPYPSHTLRYTAIIDHPALHNNKMKLPFPEAGVNEAGVSVSATISTNFNEKVLKTDPLVEGGITEMSMASYILQSAKSAGEGVKILAECIDKYGLGNPKKDNPDCTEGSTILIADKTETYVFEALSGHEYIVTKLSPDMVSIIPNAIMTQQVNIASKNIIASKGLISTAQKGDFYVSDVKSKNEINIARSYCKGYSDGESYRFYYGAKILNPDFPQNNGVTPLSKDYYQETYPNSSYDTIAFGPFALEFEPALNVKGTINLKTIQSILGSHGEGTPFETTSKDVNIDGVKMYSIGTYRQDEEHIFEIRKDKSIPKYASTIEWLAMGPSEFSVYIPIYSSLLTKVPDAYSTDSIYKYDVHSLYWAFNELGNYANGSYYRKTENGTFVDRFGNTQYAIEANKVNEKLSSNEFKEDIRSFVAGVQLTVNDLQAKYDQEILEALSNGNIEEAQNLANACANECAVYALNQTNSKLGKLDLEASKTLSEGYVRDTEGTIVSVNRVVSIAIKVIKVIVSILILIILFGVVIPKRPRS